MFTIATLRSHAGRTYAAIQRQPGWLGRLVAVGFIVVLVALGLLILIPVVVIVLCVVAANVLAAATRKLVAGAAAPNGVLDGRRNVRVRTSHDAGP